MKLKPYINSFLLLLVALASFLAGRLVGFAEERELAETIIENLEYDLETRAFDTEQRLKMLFALKEGEIASVIDILQIEVKSGLSGYDQTSSIRIPEVDALYMKGKPSESAYEKAKLYQSKFCTDNCLGVTEKSPPDNQEG